MAKKPDHKRKDRSYLFLVGAPYSGINLIKSCFTFAGLDCNGTGKGADGLSGSQGINLLLFQELGISPFTAENLPDNWQESSAAKKAATRINDLIAGDDHAQMINIVGDSMLCRVARVWLKVFDDLKFKTKFIHIIRHPWEVASSLKQDYDLDLDIGHKLWLVYFWEAKRLSADYLSDMVVYDKILVEPLNMLQQLRNSLFLEYPLDLHELSTKASGLIKHNLRRYNINSVAEKNRLLYGVFDQLYKKTINLYSDQTELSLFDNIAEIKIGYNDKRIFSVKFEDTVDDIGNHTSFTSFIEKKELNDLVDNISLTISFKNGDNIKLSPTMEIAALVDQKIIDSILSHAAPENYNFYRNYMISSFPRINKDVDIIMNYMGKDSPLLDIGSIPPLFSALLKERTSADITLIDPNAEEFQKYLKENDIKYINGDIFNIDCNRLEEKFNLVCFCEVIEHLTGDLLAAIKKIKKTIKVGGYLYLTTPNLGSFSGFLGLTVYKSGLAAKYLESVRNQYDRIYQTGYPGHVREYTDKEIIHLFESEGFVFVDSFYQVDYRINDRFDFKLTYLLESMMPNYKLFGKYLFRRK